MKDITWLSRLLRVCSASILVTSILIIKAHAASLQVAPILLEFSPNERVKELWLTNTGNESIRAQVRVNEWVQENQRDTLMPSKSLIASPMVLSIPAQQRQLVRLIRNSPVNNTEQAFRLIVDELPNKQQETKSGLTVLLKYSIPVFFKVSNSTDVDQRLSTLKGLTFKYSPQKLTVNNQSDSYRKFSQFAYVNEMNEKVMIQQGLVGYVMSGQTMEWTIPNAVKVTTGGKFVAVVNSDLSEQTLPLSP